MINIIKLEEKTIDHRLVSYPEQDPFEVKVQSFEEDEEIQLTNYRYKAQNSDTPKAVLMIFHGYGSYTGKYAYYAKYFAEEGYDVVGFDFRGFGRTKGQRGHISSWEDHIKDCWTYYDIVREQYDNSIPFIGVGYSLGGGTVFSMVMDRPEAFKGIIQLVPFAGYAWGKYHWRHFEAEATYKFYPRVEISPGFDTSNPPR